MSEAPVFTVDVDQNSYLPVDGSRVDAIVTLTATDGAAGPAPASDVLEVIVIDCSTSMTGSKIRAARQATAAAIGQLRDGVSFAVVAGNHVAQQVYPAHGTAVADDRDPLRRRPGWWTGCRPTAAPASGTG